MSNIAIVTMTIGDEAESIGHYSLPTMRAYAKRCNADFILLEQSSLGREFNAFYEKCQVAKLLEHYERVLYLDADILVLPDSPDVFAMVPADRFGAVSVDSVFRHLERSKRLTQQVLGTIDWNQPYFNAGVMLVSRAQQALVAVESEIIDRWHRGVLALGEGSFHDQDLYNYRLNALGLPLFDMGRAFNFTRAWGDFHQRFAQSFVHYAGLKGVRNSLMRRDAGVIGSDRLRRLYAANPWLVWLRDRVYR